MAPTAAAAAALRHRLDAEDDEAAPAAGKTKIDYEQSMFWQVGHLGKEYDTWVHSPSSRSFRMFRTDFMEFFSRTHWAAVPVIWLPMVVVFAIASLDCNAAHALLRDGSDGTDSSSNAVLLNNDTSVQDGGFAGVSSSAVSALCRPHGLGVGGLAAWFVGGAVAWTFIEYALHRWVFHVLVSDSWFWVTFHFVMHGQHHKFPLDNGRLVFPPVAAAIITGLFHGAFLLALPTPEARALTAGALLFYVLYDLTHYYIHFGGKKLFWLNALKQAHMDHHYRDCSKGFGISNQFWDMPFGTLVPARSA
eukprot:m.6745 g.6745  ORF g.6745 m.6745 type:complete len:305 (-) comp2718_c0_seq1:114-1028(-)